MKTKRIASDGVHPLISYVATFTRKIGLTMSKKRIEYKYEVFGCNKDAVKDLVNAMGFEAVDLRPGKPAMPGNVLRWKQDPTTHYTVISKAAYERRHGFKFDAPNYIPALSKDGNTISLSCKINEHLDGTPISEFIDD